MRLPEAAASSISISMMRSLIGYQAHITKSCKTIKYEGRAPRRLPRQDKEEIELNVVVKENGSVYNADIRKALAALIRAAADKMESRHLTILGISAVLILAVGYFGSDTFKAYVVAEVASRDLATRTGERIRLSEEETARAKIIGSVASESEQARRALAQVEASYQALLRGAASAGNSKILGVDLPQDLAKELVSNPRRSGEGTRLDGQYEVSDIERHDLGVFSVILQSSEGQRITADARSMFLPDNQIDLLLTSLKTGRRLNVMVNAWQRDGRTVAAEIARVDPPEQSLTRQ
jgi:hypothetical protein